LIEATGDPLFGTEYLFVDTPLQPDTEYTYWLQQLDVTGTSTEYGPVTRRTPVEPTDEPHSPVWQIQIYIPLLGGR
jgi:chitodextrinase